MAPLLTTTSSYCTVVIEEFSKKECQIWIGTGKEIIFQITGKEVAPL